MLRLIYTHLLSKLSLGVDFHARLLFSRTGASAIVLVDHEQPAREMQVCEKRLQASTCQLLMTLQTISTLTWLSVFYLHREDEVAEPVSIFCELPVSYTRPGAVGGTDRTRAVAGFERIHLIETDLWLILFKRLLWAPSLSTAGVQRDGYTLPLHELPPVMMARRHREHDSKYLSSKGSHTTCDVMGAKRLLSA